MKIGYLRYDSEPGNKVKTLAYMCFYHNIEFFYFRPEDVDLEREVIKGKFFLNGKWEERETSFPSFIDNAPSKKEYRALYLELERKMSIPMMCHRIDNKQKINNLLVKDQKFGDIVINTERFTDIFNFNRFLERYNKLILKPIGGNMGRGIYKVYKSQEKYYIESDEKIDTFKDLVELNKFIVNMNFLEYIQQEYIESTTKNNLPFDIRVHVRRGANNNWSTVKIYPRVGINQNVTSNISQGGGITKLVPFLKVNYPEYQIIQKKLNLFAKEFPIFFQKLYSFEIDALGIDIGLTKDGNLKLFEVNTFPGTNFLELEDSLVRVQYYLSKMEKISL